MFRAFINGFQVSFPNDLTVSVVFGEGDYCQNRSKKNVPNEVCSKDAEFVVFHSAPGGEDVYDDRKGGMNGWVSPVQIAEIIHLVSIHSGSDDELRQKIRTIVQV